jgi:hypothetical protein
MSSFKNLIWNKDDQTIRGSFINTALTIIYLLIIVSGLIWARVAKNISEMSSFLIGFYGVSFCVWATKKTVEIIKTAKSVVPDKYGEMINKIFGLVSISSENGTNDNKGDKTSEKEAAK